MYLLYVNRKNQKLKRLLYSWTHPGTHRRDLSEYLVKRMSTNVLLLEEDPALFRVFRWLQDNNEKGEVLIFRVQEVKESYHY